MKHKNYILLILVIAFLFPYCANAQASQNQQYLQSVGVLDSLYSEILGESRALYIQLPNSYNAMNEQNYPVVYILDGEVFLPAVSTVLDFYSGGFMPKMILVGISNSTNRTRDLTTSKIETKYGMPFNEENGEAEIFMKFMVDELIPTVDKKYRTTPFRTLIGHSYGGLFTINALLNHTHVFANYLAIDPSLDWDNQKLLMQAGGVLAKNDFTGKSLFMSLSGQLHMQNPEITFDNVMQDTSDYTLFSRSNIALSNLVNENEENGLHFEWKFYPRDLHGTIPLVSSIDGLISLFQWFQMEHTDKFNSPDTPKNELFDLVNYRANKLQHHFGYPFPPIPEDLFNMLGYMNLEMQQPEKAKMFFEFAMEYYPQSANACDSMADYYEALNDPGNALKFISKAYEINKNEYYKNRMEELKLKINK